MSTCKGRTPFPRGGNQYRDARLAPVWLPKSYARWIGLLLQRRDTVRPKAFLSDTLSPFNRLVRGNDVQCVTINPHRHITTAANYFRFGGMADMAGLAARSTRSE